MAPKKVIKTKDIKKQTINIGNYTLKTDRIGSGVVLSGKTPEDTISIKDSLKNEFDARYTGKKSWWISNDNVKSLMVFLLKKNGAKPKNFSVSNYLHENGLSKIRKLSRQELDYLKAKIRANKKLDGKSVEMLDVLANKLCSCIKKVDSKDEKRSIAICVNSMFKNRGLKLQKFSCKKPKIIRMSAQ